MKHKSQQIEMVFLKLVFCLLMLKKLSSANDNCSDETPWNCEIAIRKKGSYPSEEIEIDLEMKHDKGKPVLINRERSGSNISIPDCFDARAQWPLCKSIGTSTNQKRCSISWALCTTDVATDRLCIASEGTEQFEFSVQDIIKCCKNCTIKRTTDVCSAAGYPIPAVRHLMKRGLVSSQCKPYNSSELVRRRSRRKPKCDQYCSNRSYRIPYKKDIRKAYFYLLGSVPHVSTIEDIQIEIMKNGPLCAVSVEINTHFVKTYTSGVYITPRLRHKVKPIRRSVKIIGWGTEHGIPYWICVSFWGKKWGDLGGLFKVRRGTNELNLENMFTAVGMEPLPTGTSIKSFSTVLKNERFVFIAIALHVVCRSL